MKKGLKITLIVLISIIAVLAVAMIVANIAVGKAADATEYKLGNDVVSSVTAIVGERKANSVGKSIENGVSTHTVTYISDTVQEDMIAYTQYLRNEGGFTLTEDMDLTKAPGRVQMAKQSVDEGEILIITIDYTAKDYTVTLQKGVGTLTAK